MVSLSDYAGREHSYIKHLFLEKYIETLAHKTASKYAQFAYIDGFAGPWQSANENFNDTSFGIALNALRRAKATWKGKGRDVKMSAFLVERDEKAYELLARVPERYHDISIRTYAADFLTVLPNILSDIPSAAFTFTLVDPKGWRISLRSLEPILARPNSELVFNFMFEFINRAVSIKDPIICRGLDELIPFGDWRAKFDEAERIHGELSPNHRKAILIRAFAESIAKMGDYKYVAETTVLRTLKDRPVYCLFYATRHPRGIEVFRNCQVRALTEQSKLRAATKIKRSEASSGQSELFGSQNEMAPNELDSFLSAELLDARQTTLELAPTRPRWISYEKLQAEVLSRHVVRSTDINQIAAGLRNERRLLFPDWEPGRRVPQPRYKTQRP